MFDFACVLLDGVDDLRSHLIKLEAPIGINFKECFSEKFTVMCLKLKSFHKGLLYKGQLEFVNYIIPSKSYQGFGALMSFHHLYLFFRKLKRNYLIGLLLI